jgi:hypothetical protein
MTTLENKRQDYHLWLQVLAVSIQDESRHHAFKPGNIWFLPTKGKSTRAKQYDNVMPVWDVIYGTAKDFHEVFSERWLGKVGNPKHPPFHLFAKQDIGRVWFITVKKTSEFSEYGSDTNMPSGDANNLAYHEKYSTKRYQLCNQIELCSAIRTGETC